jgi:chemotaxis-related protein WspD
LFRTQGEWLALPTSVFQEVTEQKPIHTLPHRRTGLVVGLANVRGELLVCLSLAYLLGLAGIPKLEELIRTYRRLLIIQWETTRWAILVDEIQGPCRFSPQNLRTSPASLQHPSPSYTQGLLSWQNRSVGLLDPELVLSALNRSLE